MITVIAKPIPERIADQEFATASFPVSVINPEITMLIKIPAA